MMDLQKIQEGLESEMADRGVFKFRDGALKSYQRGEATSSKGMRWIMQHVIDKTAKLIEEFIAEASSGKPGPKHTAVRLVKNCDPNVLAYLAAKLTLDGFIQERPYTTVARQIGGAIEVEERIAAYSKTHYHYIKTLLKDLKERTPSDEHRRKVVMGVLKTKKDGWTPWTMPERVLVGSKMIELLISASDVAVIVTRKEGRRTRTILQLAPSFRTYLVHMDSQFEMLQPEFMPCVIPPKDWTGLTGGGYHTDAFIDPPALVKTRSKEHIALLEKADLSLVLRAINAVQATGWAVETRTLAVMQEIISRELEMKVLPPLTDLPIPPRPLGIPDKGEDLTPDQEVALADWKRDARITYQDNEKNKSRRLQARRVASLAERFKDFPAIYFPHQLDFRGRFYAIPQLFNPQGPDFAKGLLKFAEGFPLEDERAEGWFLIHGANTFGVDKVALDERIGWVWQHASYIIDSANDPLANRWWMDADSPFCFLAWCYEFRDWSSGMADFLSHLPIAQDGTCNGLQHYSAILRDPIGGAAVNLLPSDRPQDIYGEVAKVVMGKLEEAASEVWAGRANDDTPIRWLDFGINRDITKRPVMVLPYGGTISSCKDYIEIAVKKQIAEGKSDPFGSELRAACNFLATVVWESIGDVVVAARTAMGWLQDCTRIASHAGKEVAWTAPSGFVVRQAYLEQKTTRVVTYIHGERVQLSLNEDLPEIIDKRRQANGVAPNFVHSLDASALVLTVNLALDNDVTHFAMIHDSYGTHAASTDLLASCTRHAFVDQYTEHDVLDEFYAGVFLSLPKKEVGKLPQVPTAGGLDLNEVLSSQFFFA